MVKKITLQETKKILKNKTIMFTYWGCEYTDRYMYQNYYHPIKDLVKEVVLCDPKKLLIKHGSHVMKKKMVEAVRKAQPDFILTTTWGCDEFESIELIKLFRKASPKTKILGICADDDRDYEILTRYYAPYMDYNIVFQANYTKNYLEEGNLASPFYVVDTKNFKPLNLKKKYDLTFIGTTSPSRVKIMRFLLKNNVKIHLWGRNWSEYPEFQKIYHGQLDTKGFNEVISQSKINLGFSKNQEGTPHFKARTLEVGAMNSFLLVSYFEGYKEFFEENKEIAMFKNNKEMLQQINYYLKNEKEREKIAENAYKKIMKELEIKRTLLKIFGEVLNQKKEQSKEKKMINKKTAYKINEKEIFEDENLLRKKMKKDPYVILQKGTIEPKNFKEKFQIYSLEKTHKNISCCSHYIRSKSLGNLLRFRPFRAFEKTKTEQWTKLLNLNQLAMRKDYFFKNLDKIREAYKTDKITFVKKEETTYIDVALYTSYKINKVNLQGINLLGGENLIDAYQPNFALKLYARMYQKKLLKDPYIYKLTAHSLLRRNLAIIKYLKKSYSNQANWDKIKKL